ncbi:hypothetical protein GLOIN_2v1455970 [Rhizophagus clarus]|uniref:Uncharacterized protein n=1 Tax=Rhizophagus clarus TaxID=94130 RepID=A0A8H3LTA4_9GLOM|nr:hypothetical protein GLOIN_2v1455970 [Rhizophagus clarus]
MSTKRKELSSFECGEIFGTWKFGVSERQIDEVLNHDKSTVHKVISAYKNSGYETRINRQLYLTNKKQHSFRISITK